VASRRAGVRSWLQSRLGPAQPRSLGRPLRKLGLSSRSAGHHGLLRRRAIAGWHHRYRAGRSRLVGFIVCAAAGSPCEAGIGASGGGRDRSRSIRGSSTPLPTSLAASVWSTGRGKIRARVARPPRACARARPAPCCDGDDLITRRVRVNDRASHAGAQLSASDCSAACGACAWHVACDASLKVDLWLGGVWMCGLSSTGCRVLSPNVPLRPSESVGCVACVI